MTPLKAQILDSYVSPKIPFGPSASPASRAAAEAIRRDERYGELRARLAEAGFFEPATWGYAWRITLMVATFVGAFGTLLRAPALPLRLACCAAIGFALVQGGFLAHEATHGAISKRPWVIQLIGHFFQTFLVGLAFSSFWRSHELHHFHCNEPAVDPDTHSSIWSIWRGAEREKRGVARVFTRHQHVLIPLLLPIWGFQLKLDSWAYVARNPDKTRLDRAVLALHVALWFGVLPAFVGFPAAIVDYLCWLTVAGTYMAMVIPINHVAKTVFDDQGTRFLEQQLSATRNLGSSFLMDFFFMGQNNHIEHHLFPTVPCSRLHRGRAIVRDFCRREGLPYQEYRYLDAIAEVGGHLASVARARVDA